MTGGPSGRAAKSPIDESARAAIARRGVTARIS
jgi:hypothetical protein